jgi:hypothetical protein
VEDGDPGGDGIWGSVEKTDIWSMEGGGRIIGLVFGSSVGGRFGDAQCRRGLILSLHPP